MIRSIRVFATLLAVSVLLFAAARPAAAQGVVVSPPAYCPPPTVSYYAPPTVSYYPAPTVSYYAPPTVAYYPAPTVSYYAAPTVTYYAPAPAVTTYYRYGLFGRRVGAVTYYP
jgi:hypothetical protein